MNLCWPSFITLDSFCYTPFTLSRLRPRLQSWCETRSYRGDLNSCAYNRQGHNKIRKICIHVLEIHQFGENLSATALRCSRNVLLSLLAVHMPCILQYLANQIHMSYLTKFVNSNSCFSPKKCLDNRKKILMSHSSVQHSVLQAPEPFFFLHCPASRLAQVISGQLY